MRRLRCALRLPSSPRRCRRNGCAERYAKAETLKWAVTGPIDVRGAVAGGAVAVKVESVEVTTPGVVVYGAYTAEDPYEWWDDESACEIYQVDLSTIVVDERTTLQ